MTQRFLSGLTRGTVLILKIPEAIVIEVELGLNDTSNNSNSASD